MEEKFPTDAKSGSPELNNGENQPTNSNHINSQKDQSKSGVSSTGYTKKPSPVDLLTSVLTDDNIKKFSPVDLLADVLAGDNESYKKSCEKKSVKKVALVPPQKSEGKVQPLF